MPASGSRLAQDVVVAGNLLASEAVLDATMDSFAGATGPLAERLLVALFAGAGAGSDSRGLQSAALLIVGRDMAPLTLRVDLSEAPLRDLRALYDRSQSQPYAGWCDVVPTLDDPHRAPKPDEFEVVAEQAAGKA